MPLSEKVRIEIFIPDLPDPIYGNILEQLGNELTYAYGGSTTIATNGKYRSSDGLIFPDNATSFSLIHLSFGSEIDFL